MNALGPDAFVRACEVALRALRGAGAASDLHRLRGELTGPLRALSVASGRASWALDMLRWARYPRIVAKAKAYELNDKQLRFVEEYWLDANATQAAIRAGYSEKTASSQGYDLLKKPEIRARIEEKRKNLADWVRSQLLLLASSSVEHYKLENGKLTTTEDAPLNAMQAVSSLKIKERTSARTGDVTVEAEFKLWSKDRALENLGKHLAMFTEKQQISGDPDNPTPAVMLYLPRNGKTADEQ